MPTSESSAEDTQQPKRTVPAGSGYVRHVMDPRLTSWWSALPTETRRGLSALRAGDDLRPELAARVVEVGFECPSAIVVGEDGSRARRWVAPRPLVQVIQQLRLTNDDKRYA